MPANIGLALERLGNDYSLFREFVGFYFDDYPPLVADLRDAVRNRDCDRVHHAAHALKGLVANLGADAVVSLAMAIEQRGLCGDLSDLDGILETLEREIERLNEELNVAIGQ